MTGAVESVLVALVDKAEAGEGEQIVDLADVVGAAGDEACEATGGDGASVRT
jgi:HD superfamily phosphodiesterase